MEYREMLYIRTIAKYRSITKASEELFIAQPSLTQALHRAEEEYGAVFFQRGKSGLKVTDAGKMYLDAANRMEKLYNEAKNEMRTTAEKHGSVCFGMPSIQGCALLPEFLRRFHAVFPNVELKLCERSSFVLEQMVAEGALDMALLHRPFVNYELNCIPIYDEPFLLAVSTSDEDYRQLFNGKDIPVCSAEILAKKNFILPGENLRARGIVDSIFSFSKVTPKVVYTTTNMLNAMSMAGKGLGATVVPRYLANTYKEFMNLNLFSFPAGWNARWELVAAFRENYVLPDVCNDMVRILQETVASMPEIFE